MAKDKTENKGEYKGVGKFLGTLGGMSIGGFIGGIASGIISLVTGARSMITGGRSGNGLAIFGVIAASLVGLIGTIIGGVKGYKKAERGQKQFQEIKQEMAQAGVEKTAIESQVSAAEQRANFLETELKRRAAKEEAPAQGAVVGG